MSTRGNGTAPEGTPSPLSLLRAAPAVARFGVITVRNLTQWGVEGSLHAALRVARAAALGETPTELLEATVEELRDRSRRLLGIPEIESSVRTTGPQRTGAAVGSRPTSRGRADTPASLRARGAELLRLSADVSFSEQVHPAYAHILGELAPDEARILRYLAIEGPQPSVDVRTARPLAIGSQMTAPGLTMIGTQSGCRHLDRVPAYLNNLERLGLLEFSKEPLADALRYQVLEVQPDVMEAKKRAGHARTVRRSIRLTPFGGDFCHMCLPLQTAEVERLAAPETPETNGSGPAP
jgi:hypothetical protein